MGWHDGEGSGDRLEEKAKMPREQFAMCALTIAINKKGFPGEEETRVYEGIFFDPTNVYSTYLGATGEREALMNSDYQEFFAYAGSFEMVHVMDPRRNFLSILKILEDEFGIKSRYSWNVAHLPLPGTPAQSGYFTVTEEQKNRLIEELGRNNNKYFPR